MQKFLGETKSTMTIKVVLNKAYYSAHFHHHVNLYVISIQSNPTISNSVNSKSPLFRRKIEFPWIYPYVFSHLLSAISNSVISNSPLFRTHRSFPTP